MREEIDLTCHGDSRYRILNVRTGEVRWGEPIDFMELAHGVDWDSPRRTPHPTTPNEDEIKAFISS